MMISPETYYELNLKDKNEKELLSVIRGLKNKIGHLKNIMEHPDYQPLTKPDEATQIWCMKLYLERAIQALKDMGGTYIPSKAELKVEEFNNNIPNIKEINFRIGGFTYGHTDYTFKFDDNKSKKIISKMLDEVVELSLEDKDDFLDGFAALNIGEWRLNYDTERFGYCVMDGTQWELEIHYSNGNKTKSYYGSNAYPYNFNKLLELFEYDYEDEEDDDVRLNYTISLDDKNELLLQMYKKAKELPFGTEISTSDLLSMIFKNSSYIDGKYIYDDLVLEMKDMFSIDLEFKTTAADNGIEIDDTIHTGEVLGMPFHIGFLIKSY
ncbi:MAG: hypothetical protein PUF50_03480 [Erysipelotrichaceae bacterium]|nr:hypothetical protein [Erysipelotrichaceae bacterium]